MSGRAPTVVLLAAPSPATNIVFHALARAVDDVVVVMEEPMSRWRYAKRRASRIGLRTVASQSLFVGGVVPLLRLQGRSRIRSILDEHGLDDAAVSGPLHQVGSVNADETVDLLRRLDPAVVVLNGTRVVSARTLAAIEAPVINMHAGITPRYRGVHGGYWALVEGREDLVGTTVHYVDEGIDTGPIIAHTTFTVTDEDTFATYPYLHTAAGVPALTRAVQAILAGQPPPQAAAQAADATSVLRTHPTLGEYLRHRRTGVR